nr:AMP-binding protein [Streptomyces deccanensis]
MRGSLGRPEGTARTIVDGWSHTGGVGHLDAGGYLFLVGRSKDMIIRGGENIYPKDWAPPQRLRAADVVRRARHPSQERPGHDRQSLPAGRPRHSLRPHDRSTERGGGRRAAQEPPRPREPMTAIDYRTQTTLITGASRAWARSSPGGSPSALEPRACRSTGRPAGGGTGRRTVRAARHHPAAGEALATEIARRGITVTSLINNAGFGTHGQFRRATQLGRQSGRRRR